MQLPDTIQEFCQKHFQGQTTTDVNLTHLHRELMHAVWLTLLDDEFIDAYVNGILIEFIDGVTHRVFPHILTYSADYPEKCVLFIDQLLGY